MKDIVKLGGKILPSVPVDGNESRDTVVVDEKTGRAVRNGPIFVVSHPREFRKPNYLMALATGELFNTHLIGFCCAHARSYLNICFIFYMCRRHIGALPVDRGLQRQQQAAPCGAVPVAVRLLRAACLQHLLFSAL